MRGNTGSDHIKQAIWLLPGILRKQTLGSTSERYDLIPDARQPRHSFLRPFPAYVARSGNFEAFLEIFSTLFCKNWRESPWKRNIPKKQTCHAGEEISNSCFFKDGDEKL